MLLGQVDSELNVRVVVVLLGCIESEEEIEQNLQVQDLEVRIGQLVDGQEDSGQELVASVAKWSVELELPAVVLELHERLVADPEKGQHFVAVDC